MSVKYDDKNKVFNLSTKNTTYLLGLYKDKILMHIYYGNRISSEFSIDDVLFLRNTAFSARISIDENYKASEENMNLEYSCFGNTDLREPSFLAKYSDGSTVTKALYDGYRIFKGKPEFNNLPSAYAEENDGTETLEIKMTDKRTGLVLLLCYTVYEDFDVITRSVKVLNCSSEAIQIEKIMSLSLDMQVDDFELISLCGGWAKERHIKKVSLTQGIQKFGSIRGHSSHQHNPFFAISKKNTDEIYGDAYGFGLVYSGNFTAGAEVNQRNTARVFMGINDLNFSWRLSPNEEFQAPEVIMTYSKDGFGGMSRAFHKFINERIVRGSYKHKKRPVLINNWEATYFDFNEEKLLNIAKTAKELGVELMVLDDGWFGKRNSDNCSLGDWYADTEKLPNGIDGLAEKINNLGMKFGLWFEPEMISPDSDLFRAHPEWVLGAPNASHSESRQQLILDLTRKDVCDYIIKFLSDALDNGFISYVKWDMNRSMSEVGSCNLPPERQQETAHRYMLGLYYILETIMNKYPDILFEGCSGGGGRFDLGMLCYFPQIWTSDDTDAVERMFIQYGTSLFYPTSVMGAHVSAVPNHQTGRVTSIKTRGNIATMGRFGYELDLNTLTDVEKETVKKQIEFYKKWGEVIHSSDVFRLKSPFDSEKFAMEFVSEKYIIVFLAQILNYVEPEETRLYFKGIDEKAKYKNTETGKIYGGDVLANIGLQVQDLKDYDSLVMIFEKL